jgi:hypothetical protein
LLVGYTLIHNGGLEDLTWSSFGTYPASTAALVAPTTEGKKLVSIPQTNCTQRNEFYRMPTILVLLRFNRELGKSANLLHQVSQQAVLAI